MNTLKGNKVYLRALEPTDLEFLYVLENDESIWEISNTTAPYSKFVLKQYLENSHRDIFEVKQLRLVICSAENDKALGFIDLFDFDPKNKRVGLGIIIKDESDRKSGFAKESIELVKQFAFDNLGVHQIFANITSDNAPSISLFEKVGFAASGVKKDWVLSSGTYKDELIYQYINE